MARDVELLETDRLRLRGIGPEDAGAIVAWRADPEVYRYFRNPHCVTLEEHLSWYHDSYMNNECRADWMCIEKATGQRAGVFGLSREDDTAEVSYILAPEMRGRGYASEGVGRLIRFAREAWLCREIVAEIHRDNAPSIALIERLGFHRAGVHGDFVRYQL